MMAAPLDPVPRSGVRRTAALLLAGLLSTACGSGSALPDDAPNVLLITVDTLRYDHLGLAGYGRDTSPNIDALAARGVSFERAYAPSPWTLPSMASIHTGLYPSSHTLQRPKASIPLEATTLAEALGAVGYRTDAIVANPIVHARYGHSQGFDSFDTEDAKGHDHISTPGVTARAKALLADYAGHADGDEPFFLSLLYFDPHYDWLGHGLGFAPERVGRITGEESIEELRELADTTGLTDEEIAQLVARYDEEIAFTDAGIGELLDELERLGLADNTLVVFVADHGEEFLEHGWLGHTRFLYEGMIRVPFVIADPRHEAGHGETVRSCVSTVSVMPTILELIGLDPEKHAPDEPSLAPVVSGDPGPGWDIISRLGELGPRYDGVVYSEVDFVPADESKVAKVAHLKATINYPYKVIRDESTGELEVYDLRSDPGELDDRVSSPAEPGTVTSGPEGDQRVPVGELVTSLDAWQAACAERALTPHVGHLSDEEMDELNKLGYLDTGD